MSSERNYHPYPPFLPLYATRLILGSIPPHRFCKNERGEVFGKLHSRDVNFYYGSHKNHFWKILQDVFETKFDFVLSEDAVRQRKEFLEKQKIALFDVVRSCKRINNKSSDQDLYEIEWMDLHSLLEQNPSIQTILCTSQFVRVSTLKILKPYSYIKKKNTFWELETSFKKFQIVQLYSPSPLLGRSLGKEGIQKRTEQYKKFLTKIEK